MTVCKMSSQRRVQSTEIQTGSDKWNKAEAVVIRVKSSVQQDLKKLLGLHEIFRLVSLETSYELRIAS